MASCLSSHFWLFRRQEEVNALEDDPYEGGEDDCSAAYFEEHRQPPLDIIHETSSADEEIIVNKFAENDFLTEANADAIDEGYDLMSKEPAADDPANEFERDDSDDDRDSDSEHLEENDDENGECFVNEFVEEAIAEDGRNAAEELDSEDSSVEPDYEVNNLANSNVEIESNEDKNNDQFSSDENNDDFDAVPEKVTEERNVTEEKETSEEESDDGSLGGDAKDELIEKKPGDSSADGNLVSQTKNVSDEDDEQTRK